MTDDDRLRLEMLCRDDMLGDGSVAAIRAALDEIGKLGESNDGLTRALEVLRREGYEWQARATAEIERLKALIADRECEAADDVPPLLDVRTEDSVRLAAYWRGKYEARGEAMDALGSEVRRLWAHVQYLEGRLAATCDGGAVEECDGR